MSEKTQDPAESPRRSLSGRLTEREHAFLQDVQAFIEFATRNGLSFSRIVGNLSHDISEIARCGGDLDAAKRTGFLPKVTGYAKINTQDVGQTEEQD